MEKNLDEPVTEQQIAAFLRKMVGLVPKGNLLKDDRQVFLWTKYLSRYEPTGRILIAALLYFAENSEWFPSLHQIGKFFAGEIEECPKAKATRYAEHAWRTISRKSVMYNAEEIFASFDDTLKALFRSPQNLRSYASLQDSDRQSTVAQWRDIIVSLLQREHKQKCQHLKASDKELLISQSPLKIGNI